MTIVVGIPALDEEKTIARIILRSKKHADKILVVDDGSKDDTALIAQSLGATVITHKKNLGKGSALRDCFKWAKQNGANILVTLDADGQHDPSAIPLLTKALEENGADVVIGSRATRPADMPRHRWFGERALDLATQVKVGERFVDAQSGFRAYSRKAIENLVLTEYGMGVDSEVLIRAHNSSMRIIEVPIAITYGNEASSQNSLMHGLDVTFSLVKFISIRHPLLFYGGFAAVNIITCLIFGYMTIDYYQHWGRVITNLALISVATGIVGLLSLFTGIILFTLITVVRERRL